MRYLITIVLLLTALCSSCGQNASDFKFDQMDAGIDSLLNLYHAAGASIAIVKEGRVLYTKGYGYRNTEKKLPVDDHTIFAIGSCSKAFTATILGLLEEEGRLSLDDRPSKYIPELKFYSKEMNDKVTLRHTITHGVGLSPGRSESSMILFQPDREEELMSRLPYLQSAAGVGEEFLYSNYMYLLAALVGERVTGKDWRINTTEMIFDPLGMRDSRIEYVESSKMNNYATGYAVYKDAPYPVVPAQILGRGPAGDIYSSASDMSRWMMAWLKDGGSSLISSAYNIKATSKYQSLTPPESRPNAEPGYGYGWFVENYYGIEKVHHGGSISGYCANVALFPSEDLGITVLTNQTNSSLAYAINNLIEDVLLDFDRGEDIVPVDYGPAIVIGPLPADAKINMDNPLSFDLAQYAGSYAKEGYGTMIIFEKEGHLHARLPFTTFRLVHAQGDSFSSSFTEEVPTIMTSPWLRFSFIKKGQVVTGLSMNIVEGGEVFEKVLE